MNLIVGAPGWLIALLAAVLFAAAVEDAVRLRISNLTCLGVILLAVLAMGLRGFPPVLWQNAVVFACILAVGTFVFAANVLGGGDVKLFAAVGLWLSLMSAVWFLAAVFLAGGVLAVGFILTRPLRPRATGPTDNVKSSRIPYGLAIVAGAAIVFAMQMDMLGTRAGKADPLAVRSLGK